MENIAKQEAYDRAKKRVDELKGFYGHLTAYVLVMPVLIYINYKTNWDFQWFWFSLVGWGAGLLSHGFCVLGINRIFGRNWEDRKIREYMNKDKF